jgi:hypothetical protein
MQISGPPADAPRSWHATTILTIRKDGRVVIAGDGQVSLGATIIKANARKVRTLGKGGVIGGFAGATADAFTLFERLEAKLEQYPGQLTRACVAHAKSKTATATATATVSSIAKLSLSASSLTFPDANPDTTPSIPALGGPVTITAKARSTPGATIMLSVIASDDLRSGTSTIPISALSWAASGTGFVPGTMNHTTAQPVGTWAGAGVWVGTQTYSLANSWTYAAGTYTTTLTYTLVAP